MINISLILLLNFSDFSLVQDKEEIGLIITNYYYDQWGRRFSNTQYVPNNAHPYGPYYDPRYTPYSPNSLPGADPDRFEDLFNQNQRR